MQFQILGPCEVYQDGSPLPLGGVKQRALLAALLLEAGRVVSADKLIDDLWGEEPPFQARHNLQELVSQLRKSLKTGGNDARIVTRSTGYMIEVAPDTLDLHRFGALLSEGRASSSAGDLSTAAAKLEEALALWQGQPLADLAFEGSTQGEIVRLEELRRTVVEERIDLDLALGRHSDVVGELQSYVAANPLRERPREQLMLALYRSGRQAEALETFRQGRVILNEELGLDPSPALQRMEAAILTHDPQLDLTPPEVGRPAGSWAAHPSRDQDQSAFAGMVRKTVTIVFSDLTTASALGNELDPETMGRVADRYFGEAQAVIARHGGTIERSSGDTLMAVFGTPTIHEDDAMRAVRAAVEMRELRDRINDELERDSGVTISTRTGVHTGEVTVADSTADQRLVIGDAVSVAARIEQSAEPDEIVIGRSTHRLIKDAVSTEPIEPLTIKRRSQPIHVLRLLDVPPGMPRPIRHLDSPMVGRMQETTTLRRTFDRVVRENSCHLFTVLGTAGVGKSRLIAAFVDDLQDRATVLRGRCLPYGEGITFYPLAEALIDQADLREPEAPHAARAKIAALVGADARAERVAECVGHAIGIPGSDINPEETFWAVRILLEQLASRRPVVFVIDDLQWAESTLLELVEYVADLSQDAPLLLVCMTRPELLDDHPGWAGGKLNATSILLAPLSREDSGRLVVNVLAGDGVDEEVSARIVDAAEGLPLYVEEIAALLVEEGRLELIDGRWVASGDLSDLPIPPTISALLAALIDRLPSDERRLIDIGSIMGQVFYPDAVRDLASDISTVRAGLASLVRKQFVRHGRPDPQAADALAFRHLLIRDVVYDAIPKRTRAELHRRVADWLEGSVGALGEQDEILGFHLEQACRYLEELGLTDEHQRSMAVRAAGHLSKAARNATARVDIPAAASLFLRSVQLLDEDDSGYPAFLWELGVTQNRFGEESKAASTLTEAIVLASARGDDRLEARARLDRWFSHLNTRAEGLREQMPLEVRLLIPDLEARGDDLGLTKAWQLMAEVAWLDCRFGAMDEPLEHALAYARKISDRIEENEILVSLLQAYVGGPIPVDDGVRRCEEILADVKDDRRVEAAVSGALGSFEAMRGNFGRARGLVTASGKILRELGLAYGSWEVASARWDVEMLAGEPVSAERVVRVPYDDLPSSDLSHERSGLAIRLASALCARGRYEEASQFVDISAESSDMFVGDQILLRCAGANASANLGDLGRGLRLSREAVSLSESTDALNLHGGALMTFAEVVAMTGEAAEATAAIAAALALFERKGNVVSAARARKALHATTGGDRE